MTNWAESSSSVRFTFFKESGKWYMDEAVDMEGLFNESHVIDAVLKALEKRFASLGRPFHNNFTVIVLEPYHWAAYPVMLRAGTYNAGTYVIGGSRHD